MSEKLGLIGVFSLGLLTMSIGAVRFGTSISNEGYDVVQNCMYIFQIIVLHEAWIYLTALQWL